MLASTTRLSQAIVRVGVVAAVNLALGFDDPRPTVIVGLVEAVGVLTLMAGLTLGSGPLLRWAGTLGRLGRWEIGAALLVLLSGLKNWEAEPPVMCLAVVGAVSNADMEVSEGRVRININGPAVIDLEVKEEDDERLIMVLGRQIKSVNGKNLLTHQQIASAFGKRDRQSSSNHITQFKRAGSSLSQMVLRGHDPGPENKLHPKVQELVVHLWERDPLVSCEQTCQWLTEQQLPSDIPLPTAQELRGLRRISGSLVLARNAARKILQRDEVCAFVRHDRLVRQLTDVIDRQDRQLVQANLKPVGCSGLVRWTRETVNHGSSWCSQTGKSLKDSLTKLVTPPCAELDEQLCQQTASMNLDLLHFGALYSLWGLSISQVAKLVGRSKSVVYRSLVILEKSLSELDPFPAAANFSGVLGIDEKWVRIPKSFSKKQRREGKKWRYAFFAVDALSGDLLHVEIFETVDSETVRTFLCQLRSMGIRPKVVVTDMLASYDKAIEATFGKKVVHHFCLFHHLQAVRSWLRKHCGPEWKKQPLLRKLVNNIDHIYQCKSGRTAKKRLEKVLNMRPQIETHHPEALDLLELLKKRFPLVINAIGRKDIPSTNNVTERTIKAFHRHYQHFAGLESLDTAGIQLRLFRHFYRLTPLIEPANKESGGQCVLERAGWVVRGVPLADYVRSCTEAWDLAGPGPSGEEERRAFKARGRGSGQEGEAQAV